MIFSITLDTSTYFKKQAKIMGSLSLILEEYFRKKDYGKDIEMFLIGVILVTPEFDEFTQERKPKYKKSEKYLCYDLKLDYQKYKDAEDQDFKEKLVEDIMNSLHKFNEVKIKNFDLDSFTADLRIFFAKYLSNSLDNNMMKIRKYWNIINDAAKFCNGNPDNKLDSIEKGLDFFLSPEEIVEFEIFLRERIIECDHYHIMAAAKIIEGYVSDDSYLYFRCWLISQGRDVYEKAIENPDSIAAIIHKDETPEFEGLLSVANKVYKAKTGKEMNYDMFGDMGLDYDFNPPPTKGEDWTEEDLPKICPRLYKMFKLKLEDEQAFRDNIIDFLHLIEEARMKYSEYWTIINDIVKFSKGNEKDKIRRIEKSLQDLSREDLIGFEIFLREKLIESDHYHIMAAAKIIEGYVSDDSYLYFRCWLIGQGRDTYEKALENPDSIAAIIHKDETPDFEELLSAARNVYKSKTGEEMDYDMFDKLGLNYDFNAPPTKGEDWTEEDLPKICPKLCKKFDWK
jgi:hypothetical protein